MNGDTMSRRRLERGYWNGRQVDVTDKEYDRIYVEGNNGRMYHRFPVMIHMDWPIPDLFTVESRLPRKTRKALWKAFNGHPNWGTIEPATPARIHNGRKPR